MFGKLIFKTKFEGRLFFIRLEAIFLVNKAADSNLKSSKPAMETAKEGIFLIAPSIAAETVPE